VLLASLVAGCASAGSTESTTNQGSTTTIAQVATTIGQTSQTVATTQAAPTTTEGAATTTGAIGTDSDIPQVCVDAVFDFIVGLEPSVAGFDFDNATLEEYQLLQVAQVPVLESFVDRLEGGECMEVIAAPNPAIAAEMVEFAQTEAPGAVAYLELLQAMSGLPVTGSCKPDVDTLQAYVDRGRTVFDLTAVERIYAFNLVGAINQWCPLEVGMAFTTRDDVVAFLGA